MPTKAELEETIRTLREEIEFCHKVIAQLGAEFVEIDAKIHAIEKITGKETDEWDLTSELPDPTPKRQSITQDVEDERLS